MVECRSLGVAKTMAIQADLLDPQVGPKLVRQVLDGLGATNIDILVNNAVLTSMSMLEPFEEMTAEGFGKIMQGNVFGTMSITNAVLPHLPAKGGRVINISSVASKIANMDPLMGYGASKAAVDSFTRSLAAAYGVKTRATFNSVSVAATETDAFRASLELFGQSVPNIEELMISGHTAEKRVAQPEDVAFIVGFLASEESRWINGAQIPANGGHMLALALQG